MTLARLVSITPDADATLGYIARVSNPANQDNPNVASLLRFCGQHGHWSVFEHAFATVEINTTRDIARQILRHRSFSFSEFSQRYADATQLPPAQPRECRLQDTKNRQNSLQIDGNKDAHRILAAQWQSVQASVVEAATKAYTWALENGVAKEQARALLPEGLTSSRLYMSGTLRSWVHYIQVRSDAATQKEHRLIALDALRVLRDAAPITMEAFFPAEA